jgi:23S rRNA (cytosine1962-C5)-methyltransferase
MQRWISANLLAAFTATETTAHRLWTSPDAWVERLGDNALISFKTDAARDEALAGLDAWEAETGFHFVRRFTRFLPRQNAERIAPVLHSGDPTLPLNTVVTEHGIRYGIDFAAGYSAGLFIDQRANRAFLPTIAPRRLLNTFAYTCSFSVVAALAGAETVSVDLSKKSLDRGRENFTLNGLSDDRHRFIADDVLDVLPRLERRGERFDTIILDPPTFSRGNRGRRWQVEQGLEDLLFAALEVATPQAAILLSTNCTRLNQRTLEGIARFALKTTRRGGDFHQEPPLPDFPRGEGAQTLWLRLRS